MENKVIPTQLTKAVKENWLNNLKSGKFIQGFKSLINNDGSFCCIGVLVYQ